MKESVNQTHENPSDPDAFLRLSNQLCFPLYACARKVTNLYTPVLKPFGLTYTQYLVLLVLWEQDGIPVGDLCRRLYLDSGTLTPLLKKLEERGWLDRTRSSQDERVVTITLTEKGKDLKSEMRKIPEQVGCQIRLESDEALSLYRLLYKVIETL